MHELDNTVIISQIEDIINSFKQKETFDLIEFWAYHGIFSYLNDAVEWYNKRNDNGWVNYRYYSLDDILFYRERNKKFLELLVSLRTLEMK